jgi:hypothetical protein
LLFFFITIFTCLYKLILAEMLSSKWYNLNFKSKFSFLRSWITLYFFFKKSYILGDFRSRIYVVTCSISLNGAILVTLVLLSAWFMDVSIESLVGKPGGLPK